MTLRYQWDCFNRVPTHISTMILPGQRLESDTWVYGPGGIYGFKGGVVEIDGPHEDWCGECHAHMIDVRSRQWIPFSYTSWGMKK